MVASNTPEEDEIHLVAPVNLEPWRARFEAALDGGNRKRADAILARVNRKYGPGAVIALRDAVTLHQAEEESGHKTDIER
jgi:hypothetical protein